MKGYIVERGTKNIPMTEKGQEKNILESGKRSGEKAKKIN